MKLEQQLTSLELSKKLKELGVKQESYFYWVLKPTYYEFVLRPKEDHQSIEPKLRKNYEQYNAFTVAELGEMLPDYFSSQKRDKIDNDFICWNIKLQVDFRADTEADARAKMLIYLLENNLITL